MRLKTSYELRAPSGGPTRADRASVAGLGSGRIFLSAIAPRRTSSGGFTERPTRLISVLELVALAALRRRGFAPAALRQLMDALRDYFRRRLADTLDDAGDLRLLTDGHGLFLRTRQGHIFDLLVDPTQPLVTGDGLPLVPVTGRAQSRRQRAKRSALARAKSPKSAH